MNTRTGVRATASVAALFALAVSPPSVGASTSLGEIFPPPAACAPNTYIQITSGGGSYAAPSAGVLTAWRFQAAATVPPFARLKVVRPSGGNNLTIVGQSEREVLTASAVNTFPTRIPVAANEMLGIFWGGSVGACGEIGGDARYTAAIFSSNDTPIGASATVAPFIGRIPVGATLERDADNDGYGDETQDQCPSDADTQKPCRDKTAPKTRITKSPQRKTGSKKAIFKFRASEPSTFKCSLDGASFHACTSPRTYRVGKGRHVFTVIAKDAADNADGSPAAYSWRVRNTKHR
jgi:hypothetical protein